MRDVTFGITAFERPVLLANLVRSIYRRYPMARIVVANNGRARPQLPDAVKVIDLEFDCGLSTARNAIIDQLETKYLLVLEDDFLFTDETKVEPLVEVLASDPEIGVVGGALRDINGRLACYALDIEVFRDRMHVREATHRVQFTPAGTPYRLCDMVWNFALFRREMLADHRWDDSLKVGEHCPFFHQVKLKAHWRVATCNRTAIYHVPQPRSKDYLKYRRRAQSLFEGYLQRYGINHYQREQPFHYEDDHEDRPCVVVLGVGHSGTTVASKMLHALGWNAADADKEFGESVKLRHLNMFVEARGFLPSQRARRALAGLPRPWAVKDPRFVKTLHHWLQHFAQMERKPVLLRVRRDRESMLASYQRRGAPGDVQQRVDHHLELCQQQYDRWPWMRLSVEYERLPLALPLFSMKRFREQQGRSFDPFAQYRGGADGSALANTLAALRAWVAAGGGSGLPPDLLAMLQDGSGSSLPPDLLAQLLDGAGSGLPPDLLAMLQGLPADVRSMLGNLGLQRGSDGSGSIPPDLLASDGSGSIPPDLLASDGSGSIPPDLLAEREREGL